jgi:hypothetical protein
MQDIADQSPPQPDSGELRHTLSVSEVETALVAAGVPRSRRAILRYCETAMLDAVKVPGPTGEQWFVSPASLPKAIGDLKQWQVQRAGQSTPEPVMAGRVALEDGLNSNLDTAGHGQPQLAMAHEEISDKPSATEPATARRSSPEPNIYEHPYVLRLEAQVEKLEKKYDDQVRRTEEIQIKGQSQLIELQRMTAVGQSETLADFMLKAKGWLVGPGNEVEKPDGGDAASST